MKLIRTIDSMTADTYLTDVVIPVDATLSRYTEIVLIIISNGH